MITALQIALLLILIALIGIIFGYLFGRLTCKKQEQKLYFEKNQYCEDQYNSNLTDDENIAKTNSDYNKGVTAADNIKLNNYVAKEESKDGSVSVAKSGVAQPLMSKSAASQDESKEKAEASEVTNSDNAKQSTNTIAVTKSDAATKVKEKEGVAVVEEKAKDTQKDIKETQNTTKKDEISNSEVLEEVAKVDDKFKPSVLDKPKNGEKDNLCRIKGIGNVIEGKLNKLGIYHFEQIAAWSEDEIKWVDSHLAFSGRILREDWIGQAKLLAQGGETEFSKRVDKGEVATSKVD